MPPAEPELLQGTLDLLILKSLALEEMHGMGISRRIAQITKGTFEVKAGLAVSRVVSDGAGRMAGLVLGRIRNQAKIQILSSHQGRHGSACKRSRSGGRGSRWPWPARCARHRRGTCSGRRTSSRNWTMNFALMSNCRPRRRSAAACHPKTLSARRAASWAAWNK